MKEIEARRAEQNSDWQKAATLWESIGRTEDAESCRLIADAVKRGDAYRREVEETIGEEPELTPLNVNAWQQWHRDLAEIYAKHFR